MTPVRLRFSSRAQMFAASAALGRAFAAVGGRAALAQRLGMKGVPQTWTFCPDTRVAAVSAASGVPPHELRPDLYSAPTRSADAAMAAHLAAGAHFARTGFTLSSIGAR